MPRAASSATAPPTRTRKASSARRSGAGGDGTAEKRYLETVALAARQFARLFEFAHDRTRWDLLFTYLPYPDEAAHLWLGRLDASLPGHDAAVAARLRPFFDAVLRIVDDHVGLVRRRIGADVVLAVASDHGLAGVSRSFRPNVALAAAGLLALDAEKKLDLARTRRGVLRRQLRVRHHQPRRAPRRHRRRRARRTRCAARSRACSARCAIPSTGTAVVLDVLDAREAHEPALGGPRGGDLYLSLAPGVSLSPSPEGAVVQETRAARRSRRRPAAARDAGHFCDRRTGGDGRRRPRPDPPRRRRAARLRACWAIGPPRDAWDAC